MSGSLIINARDRLRWHQRLWSDASTLIAWAFWLNLWYPVVRSFALASDLGALTRVAHMPLLSTGSAVDLPHYAAALAGTSGTLLLWNRLPASKVRSPEVQSVGDYARHFDISEDELLAGRGASVCVVHHDDAGRIVRVERRAD
jgi:poly-beta-1,6-N-acetyl-D-glucosamine biosynthesis protein PgaD